MKIKIPENLNGNDIMRRSGYGLITDRRSNQQSYVRRLGEGFYPRFHVYLENGNINLHLDQKQASYEGYHAHSGEYDGEVVEREVERIMQVMVSLSSIKIEPVKNETEEKKGFWDRLFG